MNNSLALKVVRRIHDCHSLYPTVKTAESSAAHTRQQKVGELWRQEKELSDLMVGGDGKLWWEEKELSDGGGGGARQTTV